jgi:hypothetical protein
MVCVIALSGEMSERRLKEWAESVKDESQLTPEIPKSKFLGLGITRLRSRFPRRS